MTLAFQWHTALKTINREAWQRLAQPYGFPFLDWDWLNLLETSGCVSSKTGWMPLHLSVWRKDHLIAAAPLYGKFHSRGEFVFDQQIAEVSEQLGMSYYPKLLGMSPFTPVSGYRFLVHPDEDEFILCQHMLKEIDTFCRQKNLSGCHFLRADPSWSQHMHTLGMSPWLHHALIWENRDCNDFEDYLDVFNSKRRKNIRRERRKLDGQTSRFIIVSGSEAPEAWFNYMYDFYAATCNKFSNWSHYLNRPFFQGLSGNLARYIVFVAAVEDDNSTDPVALSMLVRQGEQLYGRYWGSMKHFDHLHSEVCYYQPIQWAIANNVRFFDAGSGNAEHKNRRGFLAQPVYSLHRFYQPAMSRIWRANINHINRIEQKHIEIINASSRAI